MSTQFNPTTDVIITLGNLTEFWKKTKERIDEVTYNAFTPATESTDGSIGLVVAPKKGDQDKFLKGDGTWATAGGSGSDITLSTDTTYEEISS